jgi:sulfate/thiosulfate transport system permease protein
VTGRYAVRLTALGYLAVLLVAPVVYVFWKTFEHGFGPAWDAITTPDALHALKVTLILAAIAVPANTIFGVLAALAIVRHRFPGAGIFNAVVDLPLALSPVVVGLALLLLYGPTAGSAGRPSAVSPGPRFGGRSPTVSCSRRLVLSASSGR